jgi:hypothetical protein
VLVAGGVALVLRDATLIDLRDTRELWPAQAFRVLGVAALGALALAGLIALADTILRAARGRTLRTAAV